jgi:alkanesulfonate monooxygenase SsuD/methylene tetrahydromethanopterin reductase-like flavin-dependent oxidoreductase (luciferase family)
MNRQLPLISWVERRRARIGFGVQTFAMPDDPQPSASVIRAGQLAESLGFDEFFVGDHPAYQSEPWLHLTAIAMTTERMGLGSVVNCVYHRHPVMLARLAADLDNISGGRVVLGLGIGWNETEFAQLGMTLPTVPERQEALDEAIQIIRGVWGPDPFTFRGKHWRTKGARIAPAPLQHPSIPLLIAGAGERTTLRQVARYADACNFGSGRNVGKVRDAGDIARKFSILRQHCDEVGRPYDEILRTHFTTWLMLAETDLAAQAKLDRYYPQGLSEEQKLTRIVGTPSRVIPYFQALVDAGIQYFVVQIMDAADEETFRLLATEVIPAIHGASGVDSAVAG